MKKAKVAELKNSLSRYLAHVKRGGTVVVYERDRPVAQIVPAPRPAKGADEDRLVRLERQGVIRRGTGGRSALLTSRPVRVKGSVLEDLIAERKSGW
ncbi:MAG: type II toxin-antitoxin system Phd/YefM family antitoxin [Candidatus Rokuibacteriota bacterium]